MKNYYVKLVIKVTNRFIEDQIIICHEKLSITQLKEHLSKLFPHYLIDEENEKIFILYLILNFSLNCLIRNLDKIPIINTDVSNLMIELNSYSERTTLTHLLSCRYSYLNENEINCFQQVYEQYLFSYMYLHTKYSLDFSHNFWYSQIFNYMSCNKTNNFLSNVYNIDNRQQQTIVYPANTNLINFNNQNHNANINNNINDGRDDFHLGNNIDWLDTFYMFLRIIILFSIVYFYSSPLRFIIVTFSGFLIYLYHRGFFNTNQLIVANNAPMENNNQIEHNENRVVGIQMQNDLANRNIFLMETYNHNENAERRPGILLFTWIFLRSFVASIVPDQPNVG